MARAPSSIRSRHDAFDVGLRVHPNDRAGRAGSLARSTRQIPAEVALHRHLLHIAVVVVSDPRFPIAGPEKQLKEPVRAGLRVARRHLDHVIWTVALAVSTPDAVAHDEDLAVGVTAKGIGWAVGH